VGGEWRVVTDESLSSFTTHHSPLTKMLFLAAELRIHDLMNANRKTIVDDDNLAARERNSLNEQIDRLRDSAVEPDDRTIPELQDVADGQRDAADFRRDAYRNIEQVAQRASRRSRRPGLKLGKLRNTRANTRF